MDGQLTNEEVGVAESDTPTASTTKAKPKTPKRPSEKDVTGKYKVFTNKCTGCGSIRGWQVLKVIDKGDRIRVESRCPQCKNELPVEGPRNEILRRLG